MTTPPELNVKCTPSEGNYVDLEIAEENQPPAVFKLTADLAVHVAVALLGSARAAGEMAGPNAAPSVGDRLGKTMAVDPSSIGLSQSQDRSASALILQFGSTRFGVKLEPGQMAELGRALTEMSGS